MPSLLQKPLINKSQSPKLPSTTTPHQSLPSKRAPHQSLPNTTTPHQSLPSTIGPCQTCQAQQHLLKPFQHGSSVQSAITTSNNPFIVLPTLGGV